MSKIHTAVTAVVSIALVSFAQAQDRTEGWQVVLDATSATLQVSHPALGTVMKDVRLHVRGEQGAVEVNRWSVGAGKRGQLVLRSESPRGAWEFAGLGNTFVISSTSSNAYLTASVPAASGRIVARLEDSEGTPVEWTGTNEVHESYGGAMTINRSYVPRRNPEVMYFSLGQVSSPEFHALFDRRTDTAIEFGEGASLARSPHHADLLELTLPVKGNAVVRAIPEYYTKTLGVPYYVPFDDSTFSRAPMVWSSWTSYYDAVREDDIVRNADWLSANLKPYGFQFVQLDDGYDRGLNGEHYWIENWTKEKFPHGPQWLTEHIRSKGLRAGIWLVPNAYAGAVKQHADWYLRDKQGNLILDYQTPALDSSNPEVLAFLRKLFTTLDDWGFDYYKFDGEHALPRYVPAADRYRLHDPNGDLLAQYRRRLEIIREVLGPDRFIEGCPAGTPLNGIGFFNSYFAGHDLYNNWHGMYPLFSSISSNAFLNHLVVYVMPGEGLELGLPMTVEEASKKRPQVVIDTARTREDPMIGFGVSDGEARTVVTYVALTGVAYPLASVMPELPAERVKLLKATMPTMPVLPVDLFSRGNDIEWNTFKFTQPDFYVHNYPEILDLKVNAVPGAYDVVALTNWRGAKESRTVSLPEKLGLDAGHAYLAFDFWNQRPLGTVEGSLRVEIEPHDTRVILLHRQLERPQLIGLSRHISGAFSVRDLAWDAAAKRLRGTANTVPGDPYRLWVSVPAGMKVAAAHASVKGGAALPLEQEAAAGAVMIGYPGQSQPVEWEIEFAPAR